MKYQLRKEEKTEDFNTNLLLALFTTSNGRIRLFREMDKLGERVLYCDTDSIIYIDPCDGSSYTVPIGEALGDFSDELASGDYIVEFISSGPKAYCYTTFLGKECVKMKGFNLNFENSLKINKQTMKQLIDNEISIVTKGTQISRDVKTKNILTTNMKKRLTFQYNKRFICKNYNTLPYGTIS